MLANDKKTNRPLITALALELISRNLRRVPSSSAALERSEYARRDRDMAWYLLRGSIWQSWTKYVLTSQTRSRRLTVYDVHPQTESGSGFGQCCSCSIHWSLQCGYEGLDTVDRRVLLLCVCFSVLFSWNQLTGPKPRYCSVACGNSVASVLIVGFLVLVPPLLLYTPTLRYRSDLRLLLCSPI